MGVEKVFLMSIFVFQFILMMLLSSCNKSQDPERFIVIDTKFEKSAVMKLSQVLSKNGINSTISSGQNIRIPKYYLKDKGHIEMINEQNYLSVGHVSSINSSAPVNYIEFNYEIMIDSNQFNNKYYEVINLISELNQKVKFGGFYSINYATLGSLGRRKIIYRSIYPFQKEINPENLFLFIDNSLENCYSVKLSGRNQKLWNDIRSDMTERWLSGFAKLLREALPDSTRLKLDSLTHSTANKKNEN